MAFVDGVLAAGTKSRQQSAPDAWSAALFAGALGLASLVAFLKVLNRLVRMPSQPAGDLSHLPILTLVALLAMGSLVAGIAEELSFRGYMQVPIEKRHGPFIAVLLTGGLFGLAHLSYPVVTLAMMPYYIAVAALYGFLAYLTNATLPSMVLHACGNMVGYIDLLVNGRSELQTTLTPHSLVWEQGTDSAFWMSCGATLLLATAAGWAYRSLARLTADRRESARPLAHGGVRT